MNPYLRIALLFGTIAGLAGTIYFLVIEYGVGEPGLARLSGWEMLITLLCIIYAMGYYRDRQRGGILHFWEGAVIGMETAAISTFITCALVFIIYLIDSSVFTEFILYIQKDMLKALASEEVRKSPQRMAMIRAQLAGLPQITAFNQIFLPWGTFIKNLGIELLAIGMISALMRKNVNHLSKNQEPEVQKKK